MSAPERSPIHSTSPASLTDGIKLDYFSPDSAAYSKVTTPAGPEHPVETAAVFARAVLVSHADIRKAAAALGLTLRPAVSRARSAGRTCAARSPPPANSGRASRAHTAPRDDKATAGRVSAWRKWLRTPHLLPASYPYSPSAASLLAHPIPFEMREAVWSAACPNIAAITPRLYAAMVRQGMKLLHLAHQSAPAPTQLDASSVSMATEAGTAHAATQLASAAMQLDLDNIKLSDYLAFGLSQPGAGASAGEGDSNAAEAANPPLVSSAGPSFTATARALAMDSLESSPQRRDSLLPPEGRVLQTPRALPEHEAPLIQDFRSLERDLDRIFAKHVVFRHDLAMRNAMRCVTAALTVWRPEAGYCQSTMMIVGFMLLHVQLPPASVCTPAPSPVLGSPVPPRASALRASVSTPSSVGRPHPASSELRSITIPADEDTQPSPMPPLRQHDTGVGGRRSSLRSPIGATPTFRMHRGFRSSESMHDASAGTPSIRVLRDREDSTVQPTLPPPNLSREDAGQWTAHAKVFKVVAHLLIRPPLCYVALSPASTNHWCDVLREVMQRRSPGLVEHIERHTEPMMPQIMLRWWQPLMNGPLSEHFDLLAAIWDCVLTLGPPALMAATVTMLEMLAPIFWAVQSDAMRYLLQALPADYQVDVDHFLARLIRVDFTDDEVRRMLSMEEL